MVILNRGAARQQFTVEQVSCFHYCVFCIINLIWHVIKAAKYQRKGTVNKTILFLREKLRWASMKIMENCETGVELALNEHVFQLLGNKTVVSFICNFIFVLF